MSARPGLLLLAILSALTACDARPVAEPMGSPSTQASTPPPADTAPAPAKPAPAPTAQAAREYQHIVQPPKASSPTAPGERPPVLVLLHGYGSNERDLMPLGQGVDARFLVVSVRAPVGVGDGRFAWYPLDGSGKGPRSKPDDVRAAADALAPWIRGLPERVGGDPERVFLMGFSQGAIMSAELATRSVPIAGVVALSGRAPLQPPSDCAATPPIFIAHGDADQVIPVAEARALRDTFQNACPTLDLTYQEIPGSAHTIAPPTRAALALWLKTHMMMTPRP